jgi:eukaryotic-like serine/threonine-protein kinase
MAGDPIEGDPVEGGIFAGRYRISGAAGRGGAAVVYRARDLRYERDVAVKVLHRELTESVSAERFAREIGIAARLTHPNILPLYDSGECGGCFYYVTPFIEGESLRSRLVREQQLTVREAVAIARGIAAALECAHEQGIVHRDIKPENLLLASGQPLVSDFGIAHVVEPGTDERMTATGLIVGTPAYMSPEQAAGEDTLDHRSDLYSLGCVLYEMLAGEAPFRGATPQAVIASHFLRETPDVREGRPSVPEPLADVVAALLELLPADRVQSATDLLAALDAVEIDARGTGSRTMPGRLRRRGAAQRQSARRRLIAGIAVLALAAGAWFGRSSLPFLSDPATLTLAVLPLTNLSDDVQQEFFADGMTDALIADLSRLQGVNVISLTSVLQYKMMRKPIREIARELNADVIVEGTLMREADQFRISAALVRGRDEHSLWRRSYDGPANDLFALQRQVSAAVAREIGARLSAPGAQLIVKPESQDLYYKGAYYAKQWRLDEALSSFQRAVEIDPANAPAYAALARVHYFRAMFGEVAPLEAFSQMRRAADEALQQDPSLGEAYGLLALVNTHLDYDWAGADEHFGRALELEPSNAQVHHDHAHFLLAMGRGVESVEASRRSVKLDPANPMLMSCLGWHSLFDNRFDDSLLHAAEAQMMMPSFWAQIVQGWAYAGKGEHTRSVESMREAVSLAPGLAFARAALAHALARSGMVDEAHELLNKLLAASRQGYVSAYDIAIVYTGLGENDAAFEWIANAIAERSMFVVHLTWDSRLEPLRADERFAELVMDGKMAPSMPGRGLAPS